MSKVATLLSELAFSSLLAASCAQLQTEGPLRGEWDLVSSSNQTFKASVPSTVMGALVENGFYEESILSCDNYDKLDKSLFDGPWTYRKNFSLSSSQLEENILLEFDGLNYYADIVLNGNRIASSDTLFGPYRRHSFDISSIASRKNTLEVTLSGAKPGDLNIGFVDWNPRPLDSSVGIFRDVRLDLCSKVQIASPAVFATLDDTFSQADLLLKASLRNLSDDSVTGNLTGTVDGKDFSYEVTVPSGKTLELSLTPEDIPQLHISNPRLWWCRNMGPAEMYDLSLEFKSTEGKVLDSKEVSFGIRDIKSTITEDGTRQLFLNGKRVLLRGAGWTDDIFLRNPDYRNEIELAYVTDMNLNTVRFENIWGISQNVYDLCDRNGLLVMLGWSCFWEWEVYTGAPDGEYGCIVTPEQFSLMGRSLEDQMLWLRNHPSIVMFLGGSDKTPHPDLERIYMDVLEKVAPGLMYVTSAKGLVGPEAGLSGMRMVGPYDYVGPSYWFEPEAAGSGVYGFNTETGVGAQIPQKESVKRMIPQEDLWPVGKMWDYHCTTAGEAMHSLDVLKDVMDKTYGKAESLDDFLKKADLLSYDGTRSMFEAFRMNISRTGGIIQWMLNSAWPSMYWQLYDWYLAPTAAYYAVRHANLPVQMMYDYKSAEVKAVNETSSKQDITRQITFVTANGQVLFDKSFTVSVSPCESVTVTDIPFRGGILFVGDNVYAIPSENEKYAWDRADWIRTPLEQGADFAWMDSLETADVQLSVNKSQEGIDVTLTNVSDTPAFFIRMALLDKSGNLTSPAHWSDNYISLRPHEKRTFTVETMSITAGGSSLLVEGWNVTSKNVAL